MRTLATVGRLEAVPARPLWRYCRITGADVPALPRRQVLVGDAREQVRRLPTASVDCCVTSPPYYQLRDYGVAAQLGTEPHVEGWVESLCVVLSEVARVLKPTGSLWLNLGDGYSRHPRYGAPSKSLLLGPERLLLALAADGWLVRNKVYLGQAEPDAAPCYRPADDDV